VRPELAVPGVPETLIGDALLARLPANLAPPPWTVRCQAVVWLGRGGAEATAALPPSLRSQARGLAVVGGFVRYLDTPVGTYDEVFGMVVSRHGAHPWGHLAFMAVDSESSLVAGRANWAMPKTLAAFEGSPESDMTARGLESTWSVSASPRAFGPTVPCPTPATARQEFPDGSTRDSLLTGTIRMRPAVVTVDVTSAGSLPRWLRPGRHPGAVSPAVTFSLGAPA
jgi:hypothetical protein